jgi:hypothetical protein
MKTIQIESPIELRCVKAVSFPEGVMAAFRRLHEVAPPKAGRIYISISWLGNAQQIEYLAGATELFSGEIAGNEFVPFSVKEGEYLYIDIHNFMNDIPAIGQAFSQLLALPEADPDTVCVEWYMSDRLCRCMVQKR